MGSRNRAGDFQDRGALRIGYVRQHTPRGYDGRRRDGWLSWVSGYRVQKLRIPHQDWFQEDFHVLLELLREGRINPVVAERLPLSEARRAPEQLSIEGKHSRVDACSGVF